MSKERRLLVLSALALSACSDFNLAGLPSSPPAPRLDEAVPARAFASQAVELRGAYFDAERGESPKVSVCGQPVRVAASSATSATIDLPHYPPGKCEVRLSTSGGEALLASFELLGEGHLQGGGVMGKAKLATLPFNVAVAGQTALVTDAALGTLVALDSNHVPTFLFIDPGLQVAPVSLAVRDDGNAALLTYTVPESKAGSGRDFRLAAFANCSGQWTLLGRATTNVPNVISLAHSRVLQSFLALTDAGQLLKVPDMRGASCQSQVPQYSSVANLGPMAAGARVAVMDGIANAVVAVASGASATVWDVPGPTGSWTAHSVSLPGRSLIGVDIVPRQGGPLAALLDAAGELVMVDYRNGGTVTQRSPVLAWANDLRASGGKLYVLEKQKQIRVFDSSGIQLGTIATSAMPMQIAPSGQRYLWATTWSEDLNGSMLLVDGDALGILTSVSVTPTLASADFVEAISAVVGPSPQLSAAVFLGSPTSGTVGVMPLVDGFHAQFSAANGNRLATAGCSEVAGGTCSPLMATVTLDAAGSSSPAAHQSGSTSPALALKPYADGFMVLRQVGFEKLGTAGCGAEKLTGCLTSFADLSLPSYPAELIPATPVADAFAPVSADGSVYVAQFARGADGDLLAARVGANGKTISKLLGKAGAGWFTKEISTSWDGRLVALLGIKLDPATALASSHLALFFDGQRVTDKPSDLVPIDVSMGGAVSVAAAPDGAAVYVGTSNGSVKVLSSADGAWQTVTISDYATVGSWGQSISALRMTTDGRHLAGVLASSPPQMVVLQ